MKRIFAGIPLVLLALALAGCGKTEQKVRIGVSIPAATHGWSGGVVWCAEQAKKELEADGKTEVILVTSADAASQVDRIENLLTRDLDALVVMAQEPGPLTAICEQAVSQGIFLTVVSNPLDKKVENIFVNGDNRSFGAAAAQAMGKLLDGKGDILVMEGIPCPINTDRVEAFREELAKDFPNIKIMESQTANWNTEKGLAVMENFLMKYSKIDAVWAGDDDVLIGALKGYAESGRQDVKAFVGGGGAKVIVKKILDGDPLVKATVTYPPQMLKVAIDETVKAIREGKTAETGREIIVKSQIITSDNAQAHYYPDSVY